MGLTQAEVAQFLKVSKQTYCHYEKGRYEPDISTLKKLADFFECSIDYLVNHRIRDITRTPESTPLQKSLCADILSFDEEDCMRVEAFMEGLKSTRKEQKQKSKFKEGEI